MRKSVFNASVALTVAAGTLGAQTVSGTVVRPDSTTPAAGVVVVLLGERSDAIVSRAATASRGQFQLRAPVDGRYRLRVLQVGQQPTTVGPLELRADRPVVERVVLQYRPVALARFDVRAQKQCRVRPDSGLLVAQLLAEAHKALLASVASTSDGEVRADYELESRAEDTQRRLVAVDDRRTVSRVTTRPFASLPPDSIAAIGYVTNSGDSLEYRGPDAEVLLSDAFAAQHCFRVVEGTGERAGLYGVTFEPVKARRGIVDIRGTMWVEPKSSALQHVEFVYDPSTGDEQRAGVGGDVRFARTPGGLWFVSQWSIRMPRVAIRRIPARVSPRPTPARSETFVEGVQVTSGEVVSVHAGNAVLYQRVTGASVLASETPGSGTANDPNGLVRRACGTVGAETDSGAVFGRVTTDSGAGVPRMPIFAEWREEFRLIGSSLVTYKSYQRSAQTVAGGDYVLCNVPLRVPVNVFTHVNGKRMNWPEVRLTDGAPVAMRNHVLPRIAAVVATAGDSRAAEGSAAQNRDSLPANLRVRVRDENGQGIADAEVMVNSVEVKNAPVKVGRTDSAGVAVVDGLPAGTVALRVRRIGKEAQQVRARIEPGANELSVQLKGANVTLDAVRIVGNREISQRHLEIDDRIRQRTANASVTRADIERRAPINLSQMLRGIAGLRIADSSGYTVAIASRAKKVEKGELVDCVMRIMIDGIIMSASSGIDNVAPVDVYAIEVYYGVARVPPQFSGIRTDAWCGLIAIWTR